MNIILGEGIFTIGGIDVGLVRGGGRFTVEREYRQVEADGDYGPVKGRIRKTKSTAKLTMSNLEILPSNLSLLHPATKVVSAGGVDAWSAKRDVEAVDYNSTVTWTGRTMEGRPVKIELQNAINLENIDWPLVDKDEVVSEATYTATYDPLNREEEPWGVEFLPVEAPSGGLTALAVADNTSASVTLTPAFSGGVYSYTAAIAAARTHVTVTPTAAGHVIKVNGATVNSGQVSGAINIAPGELKLITVVVQEPNKLPKTYELRIYRAV